MRLHRLGLLFILLLLALTAAGCVQRRMIIRSNPPGALAYVDDHEVGMTPCAAQFIYYGNRKIRLVKDGYETETWIEPMSPPWYEIPPLDLVSENFVPGTLRDVRVISRDLRPQAVVPPDQLRAKAEQLRSGTQANAAGLPPAMPGMRVNPPQGGPALGPPPAAPPVGGQPLYELPPGGPMGPGAGR